MKKIILFFGILFIGLISSPNTSAQDGYTARNIYLDIGVGFPRYSFGNYWYGYGYNQYSLPYFRANVEYGFNYMFSGGVFGGYGHYGWKWTEQEGTYDDRYTHWAVGGRFTWHIWNFLNEKLELGLVPEQLDVYASVMTGANIITHTNTTPGLRKTTDTPYFYGGGVAGVKYFFSRNSAVFIESGYGSGTYGIVGFTIKM